MASRRPRNLSAYLDVKAVLDTVLERGIFPARYLTVSMSQAHIWRQRCNKYRKILRQMDAEERGINEALGETKYDKLIFRTIDLPDEHGVAIDRVAPQGSLFIGGELVSVDMPEDELKVEDFGYQIEDEE